MSAHTVALISVFVLVKGITYNDISGYSYNNILVIIHLPSLNIVPMCF